MFPLNFMGLDHLLHDQVIGDQGDLIKPIVAVLIDHAVGFIQVIFNGVDGELVKWSGESRSRFQHKLTLLAESTHSSFLWLDEGRVGLAVGFLVLGSTIHGACLSQYRIILAL